MPERSWMVYGCLYFRKCKIYNIDAIYWRLSFPIAGSWSWWARRMTLKNLDLHTAVKTGTFCVAGTWVISGRMSNLNNIGGSQEVRHARGSFLPSCICMTNSSLASVLCYSNYSCAPKNLLKRLLRRLWNRLKLRKNISYIAMCAEMSPITYGRYNVDCRPKLT